MAILYAVGDTHADNLVIDLNLFLHSCHRRSDNSPSNDILLAQEQRSHNLLFVSCFLLETFKFALILSHGQRSFGTSPFNATRSHIRISYKVKISVLNSPTLSLREMTVLIPCSLSSRSVVSQFDHVSCSGCHQHQQYVMWPDSLIFLGINFVLSKHQSI